MVHLLVTELGEMLNVFFDRIENIEKQRFEKENIFSTNYIMNIMFSNCPRFSERSPMAKLKELLNVFCK